MRNFNDQLQQNNGKLFENDLKNQSIFNTIQKYQFNRNFKNSNRILKKRNKKIRKKRMNFNENNNEKSLKTKNINNKIIITKKRINTNKFSNKFKNSFELMRTQLKERMLNEREKKRDNEKERNEETIRRLLLDDRNQILSSSRNNLTKESTNNETIENYLTSTKMPQINRQENNDYEEYRHYSAKERENNNKDKIEGIIENENYITRDEDYYTKIRRLFKNNEKNKEKKNENKGIVDERNAQRSRYLSRIKTINR